MGSGSYDESGRRDQHVEADDDAVTVHENDRGGEVDSESGASTGELLDQLEEREEQ